MRVPLALLRSMHRGGGWCRRGAALWVLLLALGASTPVAAETVDRDERRTAAALFAYERTEHWPIRALTLLGLGSFWHPSGAKIVADALASDTAELNVYGLEVLTGTKSYDLRMVLTKPLMEALIQRLHGTKHTGFQTAAMVVLRRTFPEVDARTPDAWRTWWIAERPAYEPEGYAPENLGEAHHDTVASVVDRAFDLQRAGLDLVLCFDTTGSMQPTIDAARDGVRDLMAILGNLSAKFRVGIVQYRDIGDFPRTRRKSAAETVSRLLTDGRRTEKYLAALSASGGGDVPERIVAGLEKAYRSRLGWSRSANKIVVIVGDAPPHDAAEAERMAALAYADPAAALRGAFRTRGAVTGRRPNGPRPFITSCVLVGRSGPTHRRALTAMERIAAAGHGTCTPLGGGGGTQASAAIVTRLIELRFGER